MTWNKDRIVELVLEAGTLARGRQREIRRELKADHTIVTAADRDVEALLSGALEDPDAGTYFIGEETVEQKGDGYIDRAFKAEAYVVDPIDGTMPYAFGFPTWGVSVGRMVEGVLTDGAVYLPGLEEFFVSDGDDVLEGRQVDGEWRWRVLPPAEPVADEQTPIAITQKLAREGQVHAPNPVLVLGAAVVPLMALLQGRCGAYLGSVKLWDMAGSWPLLLRQGFSGSVLVGDDTVAVTGTVDASAFILDPKSHSRWQLRSCFLVSHPDDHLLFRSGFVGRDDELFR